MRTLSFVLNVRPFATATLTSTINRFVNRLVAAQPYALPYSATGSGRARFQLSYTPVYLCDILLKKSFGKTETDFVFLVGHQGLEPRTNRL